MKSYCKTQINNKYYIWLQIKIWEEYLNENFSAFVVGGVLLLLLFLIPTKNKLKQPTKPPRTVAK